MKLTLFYNGPFCQWHPSVMVIDNARYGCAEQFMMAEKARLFNDKASLKKIMASSDPSEQKALGKRIKGFDIEIWQRNAKLIVYRGSHAKFTQNDHLKYELRKTEGTMLVEASPTDTVWGIGLSEHDDNAYNPRKWRGTNWLGEVLTLVRIDLLGA